MEEGKKKLSAGISFNFTKAIFRQESRERSVVLSNVKLNFIYIRYFVYALSLTCKISNWSHSFNVSLMSAQLHLDITNTIVFFFNSNNLFVINCKHCTCLVISFC